MSRQKITLDKTVRHADVSVDVSRDGVVTVTVGASEDHEHLEISDEQAIRLAEVLACVTEWADE